MKQGTPSANDKVVFISKNLLKRCACFLKYKTKKQLGSSLLRVLLQMLCMDTYV